MDPSAPTSFIPKKNLDGEVSRHARAGTTGLILLVSILIFVASVVGAGGVFAYQKILNQSITSKQESLKRNEQAYDPGVIQELVRVDDRINQAEILLKSHVAPSALFAFLSQQTLEKVQFTKFDYQTKADGTVTVGLDGTTDSFSTVALQSDQLAASKALKDIVFSGVNIDPTSGKVGFSVNATVVPSLISYASALSATAATPNPTTDQTGDASTTSQ